MSPLFTRELRRQAPYALGPSALLALAPLQRGLTEGRGYVPDFLRPEAAVFFAALLLGVASVAPDRGNGTHAFLRRLPLSLPKAFALRTGAGALWLGLVAGLAALAWSLQAGQGAEVSPFFLLGCILAYPCGALASTSTDRPLAALVLSAVVAVYGLAALFLPLVLTGATFPLTEVLAAFLGLSSLLTLAAAGFAFCRGQVHRSGSLPFGLGLACLGVLSLSSAGASALARVVSHARALPELEVRAVAQGGETLALALGGERFLDHEARVVALRPGREPFVVAGGGHDRAALSPEGRYLMAMGAGESPLGALCDLEAGTQVPVQLDRGRDLIWREGQARDVYLTATGLHVSEVTQPGGARGLGVFNVSGDWQRVLDVDALGRVYLLGPRHLARVSGLGEVALRSSPREVEVEPRAQPLAAGQLELLWELPSAGPSSSPEESASPSEARRLLTDGFVSPQGNLFVAIRARHEALLIDLRSGALTPLGDLRSEHLERLTQVPWWGDRSPCLAAFRADEGAVLVEHRVGSAVWIDLVRGTTKRAETFRSSDLIELEPVGGSPRAVLERWPAECGLTLAADGHGATLGRGQRWLADEAQPSPPGEERAWAWLADELVTGGRVTLVAGARRSYPLGGAQ